jgi:hypothetical protein
MVSEPRLGFPHAATRAFAVGLLFPRPDLWPRLEDRFLVALVARLSVLSPASPVVWHSRPPASLCPCRPSSIGPASFVVWRSRPSSAPPRPGLVRHLPCLDPASSCPAWTLIRRLSCLDPALSCPAWTLPSSLVENPSWTLLSATTGGACHRRGLAAAAGNRPAPL